MSQEPARGPALHGAVVLDKPAGPTSFRAMRTAQRRLGQRTAGHGGTLDPMASGVLVVLLGEATKLSALVMDHDKSYEAEIRLGIATDTLDAEGTVTAEAPVPESALARAHLEGLLPRFVGEVMQVPPRYSALKVDGKSHMSRARAGEDFEVKARLVRCSGLELLERLPAGFRLRVDCGKGYYVRSLARDLGEALGVPAHLAALRRTRVGAFGLAAAVPPEAVEARHVISIRDMLPDLARLVVRGADLQALRAGRTLIAPEGFAAPRALALTEDGEPVALVVPVDPPAAPTEGRRLKVQRGFQVRT
jgi:tRNA pseudouridine55 synthase